jgi:hypothetical protein
MSDKGNLIHPFLLEEMNSRQHIEDTLVEIPGKAVVEAKRAYPLAEELLAQGVKNAERGAVKPTEGATDPDHSGGSLGGVVYSLDVTIRGTDGDMSAGIAQGLTLYPNEFKPGFVVHFYCISG